jgi:hypothetical protein
MGILQRSNDALKRLIRALSMRLVVTASESSNLADPTYSQSFNRKVYVDIVSYLLKGLPRDLNDTEIETLGESMPLTLREATRRTDDMKPVKLFESKRGAALSFIAARKSSLQN